MTTIRRRALIKSLGYSVLDGEISISEKNAALNALEQEFNFTVEHYYYKLDGKFFHVAEYIDQISETTQEIRRFHFYSGKNVYAKEWNAFLDRGILVDERGRPIPMCGDSDFSDYSDEEEETQSDEEFFSDESSDFSL